jgi:hypothetical protein
VHIAELDEDDMGLLQPYLEEMAALVRTRKVYLHESRNEVEADWHESKLDSKHIHITIH